MTDPSSLPPQQGQPRNWTRIIATLVVVGGLAFGLHELMMWTRNMVGSLNSLGNQTTVSWILVGVLILYAVLIATPFMPGIEVGVALLMLHGATIAPFVYLATVTGLMAAFLIGRYVPLALLARIFRDLGLKRATHLLETIETTPAEVRLQHQKEMLPAWLGPILVDYRYVTIGALLNLPGTFAIGGGGGILMTAGLSRLFRVPIILLTLLIATLPVPLTVWVIGR